MKFKHVILGGTGHIGSALANELIARNESVLIIGHDAAKADEWEQKGATFEVADILDSDRLHQLFARGERIFILNPPAPPSTDVVKEETKSVEAILKALENLKVEKIVAASTWGARPGKNIGDLGVLYHLEKGLVKLPVPVCIIRGAYYMSNFDGLLEIVQKDGVLPTLYPGEFELPMVAPQDIGLFAAEFMQNDVEGLYFVEGPEPHSLNDVANAFGSVLGKSVKVASAPKEEWHESLMQLGFSAKAATTLENVTDIILKDNNNVAISLRGKTSLISYIRALVEKS